MQTFIFMKSCSWQVTCRQTMFLLLAFVCSSTNVLSKSSNSIDPIKISGKVTDDQTGEPIPGVNVVSKGTTNGVSTDLDGNYSLEVDDGDVVLAFTFVGYITQEVPLHGSGRTALDIRLVPDSQQMDEVLVVGYGTVKKEGVTAAIDQISGKVIEKRPVANLFQGLQGLSPGLNIDYKGGTPGAVPNINIRGVTTLTGDNGAQPLIVINGIASTADDILRLNPSDIASITILRDAASAAIYGARAAFGVILITTKGGLEGGKQRITYNNYFSFSKPTLVPRQITDPYIYSKVLETSTNNTPWDNVNYTDYQYQWARERSDNPSVEDVRLDPNDPTKWIYMGGYDWNKFFFNKAGFSQNHSISFSGGTTVGGKNKPLSYYVSADYTKENGLNKLAKDQWDRYGFRSRLTYTPIEHLKIDNNLNVYQLLTAKPTRKITDVYQQKPTDVVQNPDGTWANTDVGKLAAELIDGGQNLDTKFGFQNILQGTLSLLKNQLQITGRASNSREFNRTEETSKKYSIGYGPKDIRDAGGDGSVSITNGNKKHDVYDLFANYARTFMTDHAITALVGYNQEEYIYASEKVQRKTLISSFLPYIELAVGIPTIEPKYTTYALRSVFGRLNYTFREKYVLELNGRSDGSSRFPKEKRYGFFPSVSGAWILSKEKFFEPIQKAIPTLKFRASYGDLGNQSVNDFDYIQTLPTGASSYPINNSKQTIIKGAPSLKIDPTNYTWERVRVLNLGTDIGLLKNSLQISAEYFIRNTMGMLGPIAERPGVLGTKTPTQNVADLRNDGFEMTISYGNTFNLAKRPFNYNVKVNFWDSRAVVTKYKNDQKLLDTYREGQKIGEIWGLVNDGTFKSEDDVKSLDESSIVPWGTLKIVPGWPKYIDQNDDHKITKGLTVDNPGDLKIIGNSSDRYRFGVMINLDWYNFDFSMFVQGIGKKDFYPQNYLFWGPYQQPYAGIYPWNLDYYRATSDSPSDRAKNSNSYNAAGLADANTDSRFPVLQSWLADDRTQAGLAIPQTKYMLSGAYARLKNLTVGYTFPSAKVKKIKIERLRIYFTGDNLFEVSSVGKYFDPEAVNEGSKAWAYPFQRKFAFGLNLDF